MAITTQDQRASAVHVALPWRGLFPVPDGSINANNRAQAGMMFGDRFSPVVTSTTRLQLPINCVMAGEQVGFKTGRFSGRGLRRVFRE